MEGKIHFSPLTSVIESNLIFDLFSIFGKVGKFSGLKIESLNFDLFCLIKMLFSICSIIISSSFRILIISNSLFPLAVMEPSSSIIILSVFIISPISESGCFYCTNIIFSLYVNM